MKIRMPYPIPPTPSEKANKAKCNELSQALRAKGKRLPMWLKEALVNPYGSYETIEQINRCIVQLRNDYE